MDHPTQVKIEGEFTGSVQIVEPNRVFVLRDRLLKRSRKRDQEYDFILFNDCIIYASRLANGKLKLHRYISFVGAAFSVRTLVIPLIPLHYTAAAAFSFLRRLPGLTDWRRPATPPHHLRITHHSYSS